MIRVVPHVARLSFVLLFCSFNSYAQHPITGFPPHRDVVAHTHKKKDTVKIDPYTQDTLLKPIPLGRQLFHDKIAAEQATADAADGKKDFKIAYARDSALSPMLTRAILIDISHIRVMIENMPPNGRDSVMENQQKIRSLTAVKDMMAAYNADPKKDPRYYLRLVANLHDMIIAANENKMMAFAKANPNVYSLDNSRWVPVPPDVRDYLYLQTGLADPAKMILRLNEFATDTIAGPIIAAAARVVPDVVYNYATSTDFPLKSAVYHTNDSLVQAIVKVVAESDAPLKAIPFLPDVYHGRYTMRQIDSFAIDPKIYFANLVRLRMQDDPVGKDIYSKELAYRALKITRELNELHEEKDEVRFKAVDSLSPECLYYVMVYGQDEIYTSSFLGVFRRMIAAMSPMKGSQLLDTLHDDHFRTFIRMCAGYNTLTDFLATSDDTARTALMTRFIGGLQKGNKDDLEDAVDVADAFGSIRDSALSAFLQGKVRENYELSYNTNSKKGLVVYGILASLFEGSRIADNDEGASITSSRLHLPLINKVPYSELVGDSGTVYQQVFFFGDKDGQDSYDSYMATFRNDSKWMINADNKYWTVISSTGAHKVVIYANLPIQDPAGEDEIAQNTLCKYLADSGIHPTIVIHRGHSYHLPQTLSKLNDKVKIVILGSCGGYHNLALVLDRAPDAHIVSSKQVGAHGVNEPIIKAVNDDLLAGKDVDWIAMWRNLETYFSDKPDLEDKFSDYVPPYKNLGAIFIKAYRKIME